MAECHQIRFLRTPVNNMPEKKCLACNRSENEIPLVAIDYQGNRIWICPEHLPILIHDPARLVGKLPGAEGMSPAEHND